MMAPTGHRGFAWDPSPAVVALDAVLDVDLPQLYQWMNDVEELPLWSVRRKQLLHQEVVDYVRERSRSGIFTVIRHRASGAPAGFIEGVVRERDGIGEFLIFVGREWRKRRLVLQAIGLFGRYAFASFPLRKVYCHAYSYNTESLEMMRKGGFVEEGRFRDFIWWAGRYWDMHVFSLDRSTWNAAQTGDGPTGRFLRASGLLERST